MAPLVSVRGVVSRCSDTDGLLHASFEPVFLSSQDSTVVPVHHVIVMGGVIYYGLFVIVDMQGLRWVRG